MMEWQLIELGEVIETNLETYSIKENWKYINYLDTGSITENKISKIQKLVVSKDKIPSRAKRKVCLGDIIYSTVRPNQKHYGQIKIRIDNLLVSTGFVTIRAIVDKADNDFIYWYLSQNRIVDRLHQIGEHSTSTYPSIKSSDIESLLLYLPSLEEQKEIAKTLSNLDQKITLLRQQNETLEQMAQTLFKRWFVDFEFPNEQGRPYQSSGGKMVASELGEIPEGWRVGVVGDHVLHSTKSITPGKEPKKAFYHYSIPAYDKGKYPSIDLGETILSNKYIVEADSILVSKLNPSKSRIWTVFNLKEKSICSTEIQVFIPNDNSYAFSFGLFHANFIKKEMAQRASGTSSSHQRVRPKDILNIECIIPSSTTLIRFEESVVKLLKKTEDNQEEIQTLTKLRDSLLPKLMSGAIRVPTTIQK